MLLLLDRHNDGISRFVDLSGSRYRSVRIRFFFLLLFFSVRVNDSLFGERHSGHTAQPITSSASSRMSSGPTSGTIKQICGSTHPNWTQCAQMRANESPWKCLIY